VASSKLHRGWRERPAGPVVTASYHFVHDNPGLQFLPVLMPPGCAPDRTAPVIVLCGTPGTGKSTTAQLLVSESPVPLKHINVGDLVKEKGLHEGYDPEWQSYTVDDDKVK
jgi:hypothetical protein